MGGQWRAIVVRCKFRRTGDLTCRMPLTVHEIQNCHPGLVQVADTFKLMDVDNMKYVIGDGMQSGRFKYELVVYRDQKADGAENALLVSAQKELRDYIEGLPSVTIRSDKVNPITQEDYEELLQQKRDFQEEFRKREERHAVEIREARAKKDREWWWNGAASVGGWVSRGCLFSTVIGAVVAFSNTCVRARDNQLSKDTVAFLALLGGFALVSMETMVPAPAQYTFAGILLSRSQDLPDLARWIYRTLTS